MATINVTEKGTAIDKTGQQWLLQDRVNVVITFGKYNCYIGWKAAVIVVAENGMVSDLKLSLVGWCLVITLWPSWGVVFSSNCMCIKIPFFVSLP